MNYSEQKLIKHREFENKIRQKGREISELYKDIEEYKNQCPHNAHKIPKTNCICPLCGRNI